MRITSKLLEPVSDPLAQSIKYNVVENKTLLKMMMVSSSYAHISKP